MKNGKGLERLIMQKLEKMEGKIDNLLENVVPAIKTELAVTKDRSSRMALIITGIGGILAVAVNAAIALFK